MKTTSVLLIVLICVGIGGGVWWYTGSDPVVEVPATNNYGMVQYINTSYGFSFWYPAKLSVTATTTADTQIFPGGDIVQTLRIGAEGEVLIYVVDSETGTITDEITGHGSPIAQTKYFYNSASSTWMTAFPDSEHENGAHPTTTADVSKTTMAGLVKLASGRRFNTTILPISTTRFLVVTDGGGSAFTPELANTVARTGALVDPVKLSNALQAEANAFTKD